MHYSDFINDDDLTRYVQSMNARAAALNKPGRVTVALLRDCILESGGCCAWCGVSLLNQPLEIDHIMPLSRGGANTADNLAVTCPDCNRRKADRHPAYFAQHCALTTDSPTPLVQRVLTDYNRDAVQQLPLFDAESVDEDTRPPDHLAGDSDRDVPPYIWSQHED